MSDRLLLASPHMSDEGYELEYIRDAFSKNWVAPLGENVDEFEKAMRAYLGAGYPVALSSGTAALHLAMILAGVKHGDAVFFAALRPEVFQQRGAVHALVARTVDPAIQLRNRHGFQPAGEHVHILRPAFFQPEGAGGAEIVIARRDEDPCAALG